MPDFSSAVKYVPTDFPELRREIVEKGLFKKQPLYFTIEWIATLALYAGNVAILLSSDSWFVQLLNAFAFAFTYGRFGFLLHDAGHHQVFHSPKWNKAMAHAATLFVGTSASYWIHKHNEHHAHPNHEEMDPDVDVLILAFSEKQAREKTGIARWIVSHQHWFFFPILSLVCVSLRSSSIDYIRKRPLRETWLDVAILTLHTCGYLGLVFFALPWPLAIAFILVHQPLTGLYMGSVFAPNHKGMLMVDKDMKVDFLREQVLTARNIRSHPLTDAFYGGLNYQIEHHLFPHMPRNQLRKSHAIVKEFCRSKGIPYHETSILQSYREILESMRHLAQFARVPRASVQEMRAQLIARLTHLDTQIRMRMEKRFQNVLAADDVVSMEDSLKRVAEIRERVDHATQIKKDALLRYSNEVQELAARARLAPQNG